MNVPLLPLVLDRVGSTFRRALDQEGIPCESYAPGPPAGRFVLYDSRWGRTPPLADGQVLIDVHPLLSGLEAHPLASSARRGWRLGELVVQEDVARVDQRAVRQRLMTALRAELEAAGGVWLKLSAFPFPYQSAFNFRIDHDEYVEHDFDATLSALAGHDGAVSHYVCASTHAGHPRAMAQLRGRHVGSHGFFHHTYLDQAENYRNIGRGIQALAAAGLEPAGFAAPHGRFNRGLLDALAQLGVSHSSEFGLAYDDLPFFAGEPDVLQIPIHPICLGIALDAARQSRGRVSDAAAAALLRDHFCRVAEAKRQACEPIFLYGHPDGRLGQHPEVLRDLLSTVAGMAGVWMTTLAGFEAWWRARSRVQLQVFWHDGDLKIVAAGRTGGFRFGVELWRGPQVATAPIDGDVQTFSPQAAAFHWRPAPPVLETVAVEQPAGMRAGLRRQLDWERVTPAGEISTRTWRGWAKRTLRRLSSS